MSDERLPPVHECFGIGFLSRGTAVAALVKHYAALLTCLRARAGQSAALAANARLKTEESALEIRANEPRLEVEDWEERKATLEASNLAALSASFGPNPSSEQQAHIDAMLPVTTW